MELNRILRPGGFFIWSATPAYREDVRDRNYWKCELIISLYLYSFLFRFHCAYIISFNRRVEVEG